MYMYIWLAVYIHSLIMLMSLYIRPESDLRSIYLYFIGLAFYRCGMAHKLVIFISAVTSDFYNSFKVITTMTFITVSTNIKR